MEQSGSLPFWMIMWFSEGNTLPLVGLPIVFHSNESKLNLFTCMYACQETHSRCLELFVSSLEIYFLSQHLVSRVFHIKYHRCLIRDSLCQKGRVVPVPYYFIPGMYFYQLTSFHISKGYFSLGLDNNPIPIVGKETEPKENYNRLPRLN